jgi:hypothetical protein
LTGDVGRGCGDASRALLFSAEIEPNRPSRPTIRPTIGNRVSLPSALYGALNFRDAARHCPKENADLRELAVRSTTRTPDGR